MIYFVWTICIIMSLGSFMNGYTAVKNNNAGDYLNFVVNGGLAVWGWILIYQNLG